MAIRTSPTRNKSGKPVSPAEAKEHKTKVALNKKQQQEDQARKKAKTAFAAHQKALEKERQAAEKLKKAIEEAMAKLKADRQLDQRFMGQVKKQVTLLVDLDKALKSHAGQAELALEQPKTYTAIMVEAGRVPPASKVKTMGDLVTALAMLIVILNRVAQLKLRK